MGGGSDEIKHLNSGRAVGVTSSSFLSKDFNQLCIKCTFWKKHQVPLVAAFSNSLKALSSWPCPIDILNSLPLAMDIPKVCPKASTSLVGSTPGNNTKNSGVELLVSGCTSKILNGGCSVNLSPR